MHILRAQLVLSSFRQGTFPTRDEIIARYAEFGVAKRTATKGMAMLSRALTLDGQRFRLAEIIDGRYHRFGMEKVVVALGLDPNEIALIKLGPHDLSNLELLSETIAVAVGSTNDDDDGTMPSAQAARERLTECQLQAQRRRERIRGLTRANRAPEV